MGRKAFLDSVTGRLKAHGFIETNAPGDISLDVADDFALDPRDGWKWDGAAFVSFPFPTPQGELDRTALRNRIDDIMADGTLPAKLRAFVTALKKVL